MEPALPPTANNAGEGGEGVEESNGGEKGDEGGKGGVVEGMGREEVGHLVNHLVTIAPKSRRNYILDQVCVCVCVCVCVRRQPDPHHLTPHPT